MPSRPPAPIVSIFLRPRRAAVLACAGVVLAAACRELAFEPQDPKTVAYAPSLNVDLSQYSVTSTGVYYRDLAVGTGAVVTDSSTVSVTYRGYLASGQAFDSATAQPVSFNLRQTIAGWRSGLAGATVNSRRWLVIPASQGYGNSSRERIPAGSVLVFDILISNVTTPVTPTPPTTP